MLVYVTAHGERAASEHYLLLPETVTAELQETAFETAQLVRSALFNRADHVVVLIDSCYAGAVKEAVQRHLVDRRERGGRFPRTCAVVAAGYSESTVRVGDFVALLETALGLLSDTNTPWFVPGPYASVWGFRDAFRRASESHPEIQYEWIWPDDRATSVDPCPILPIPGYKRREELVSGAREGIALTVDEVNEYWQLKASGKTSADDPGWYFSGRAELMAKVVTFLKSARMQDQRANLMLVTGEAGTGKSAIIARAVTLSDPIMRSASRFRQIDLGHQLSSLCHHSGLLMSQS